MTEAAVIPLSDNNYIQELLEVLKGNKMEAQFNDVSKLVKYVDTMEKQLYSVLGELNSVQQQLDEIKDKQHPIKVACQKMLDGLKAQVNDTLDKLQEVKAAIIEGAKNALTAFKEKGIAALNSVMNFFNVKSGLNAVKNRVDKAITSTEKNIAKIETMSKEIHSVGSHMRNIGRALTGKETKDDVKENGKIAKVVQAPFRAVKATMSGIKKASAVLIVKLEQLDNTARTNAINAAAKKENKASILQGVKDFKPPTPEAKTPGQEKTAKKDER